MVADPLFTRLARALAGRYTLARELGRGGMATVYLATDQKLERQVAIKVLAPATRAYLGSERFQREVLLAAQLSHPHIVPLFEADEADGFLFYVMEYVEGESLEDRLQREGPLPVEEAIRITTEVGDALQYAHERGVLHRDVKPANILLSRSHAMVSDFGIAKLLEGASGTGQKSLTGVGIAVGTPEYMSPEQARGDRRVDVRSDVYALAAVLYAMLAGEPPFTGPTMQTVVARVLSDPLRPIRTLRPTLPVSVERALAWGLAKPPADRPASVREFVDALTAPIRRRPGVAARPVAWMVVGGVVLALIIWWRVLPRRGSLPPGMTLVPAGLYPVGGTPWRPSTSVHLAAFLIDSTEVPVDAFQVYLSSTGDAPPWAHRPPERWPVTGVLWSEAAAYCTWRNGRLPTEDEWEAAARGPRGFRYPWGDRWQRGRANADSLRDSFAPVGTDTLGRSWVGALDLSGNAWEWTATAGSRVAGELGHVLKGGAFDSPPENATATFRTVLPDRRPWLAHTGFRCARDVSPAFPVHNPPGSTNQ
jgi:formylglycine-generating enzyme required for sulfatase activity